MQRRSLDDKILLAFIGTVVLLAAGMLGLALRMLFGSLGALTIVGAVVISFFVILGVLFLMERK